MTAPRQACADDAVCSPLSGVTAIITAFNRPEQLGALIDSIRVFYPDLPILVGDNGDSGFVPNGVVYYRLPFDAGISATRNFLVGQVRTPRVLVLDDDYVFDERTALVTMLRVLEVGFDIVAGSVEGVTCCGTLDRDGSTLRFVDAPRSYLHGYPLYDMVPNFFLATTAILQSIKWDDELKLAEHLDFFLRARSMAKITCLPFVSVGHRPVRNDAYTKYRSRIQNYADIFMRKHGLEHLR